MILLTDLSEVLISGLFGTEQRLANRFYHDPCDRAHFLDRFAARRAEVEDIFRDCMRGFATERSYWETLLGSGHWNFTVDDAMALFGDNMRHAVPGTFDLYCRICHIPRMPGNAPGATGEKTFIDGSPLIYLVSDHIRERVPEIKASYPGLFNLLDGEYWSCDHHMLKSDPGFFPWLLRNLGIRPCDAIFIDDYEVNVAAAFRAGIPSIRFYNAHQLEAVLTEDYGFRFDPVEPHGELRPTIRSVDSPL